MTEYNIPWKQFLTVKQAAIRTAGLEDQPRFYSIREIESYISHLEESGMDAYDIEKINVLLRKKHRDAHDCADELRDDVLHLFRSLTGEVGRRALSVRASLITIRQKSLDFVTSDMNPGKDLSYLEIDRKSIALWHAFDGQDDLAALFETDLDGTRKNDQLNEKVSELQKEASRLRTKVDQLESTGITVSTTGHELKSMDFPFDIRLAIEAFMHFRCDLAQEKDVTLKTIGSWITATAKKICPNRNCIASDPNSPPLGATRVDWLARAVKAEIVEKENNTKRG